MRKGSIHLLWCERNGQTLLLVVEMKAFENIRVHNFNDLSLPMLLLVILDWKLFWKSSDTRSQAVLMIPRTWPFLLITSDNLCILISFATLFELNTLDGHIRLSFPKKNGLTPIQELILQVILPYQTYMKIEGFLDEKQSSLCRMFIPFLVYSINQFMYSPKKIWQGCRW